MNKKNFLQSVPVYLTPLSPLHIGCGEDFEPSNYVIRDRVLYHFEASCVPLMEPLRGEFLRAVGRANLSGIAKFFKDHFEKFRSGVRCAMPVDRETERKYNDLTEKGIERNQLKIARTIYMPQGNDDLVFIPGSSVKGCVHTALMDRVNGGCPRGNGRGFDGDKTILKVFKDGFADSPMRFLKVGDFLPGKAISRHVASARRLHKEESIEGIPNFFEVIDGGMYRAFRSTWSLLDDHPDNRSSYKYSQIDKIIDDLNRRSIGLDFRKRDGQLFRELEQLKKVNEAKSWVYAVSGLIQELSQPGAMKNLALLRIGMNQGAESIVLSGKGVAQIRIMHGRRRPDTYEDRTGTQWFVTEENTVVPFGWCLLEFGEGRSSIVEKWCNQRKKSRIIDDYRQYRQEREEKKKEQDQIIAQRLEKEKTEKLKKQVEAERLSSLSPEMLKAEDLIKKLLTLSGAVKPGTELYNATRQLMEEARHWAKPDKNDFAAKIGPILKKKEMYQGKNGKTLKSLLNELRA